LPRTTRVRFLSTLRTATAGLESLESRRLLTAMPAHPIAIPIAHPSAHVSGFRVEHPASMAHHQAAASGHHPTRVSHPRGPVAMPTATARPFAAPGAIPAATAAAAPYTPSQVRHAYGFDQLSQDGTGQTIAVVDAYDDPTIASDLDHFSQQFGLPAANLIKAVPTAGTPAYNSGWAGEIALDVEWAHAIAPKATILLVEAASSSMTDLISAVDYAVSQGAQQVTMSWGGTISYGQSSYDAHFNHPGVSFFASSGDSGAGVNYPAASPFVTAVGGSSLSIDTAGNRISETAWSGSGGGTTSYESRPSYQAGFLSGTRRGVPDVSYDANPSTGYYVYDTSSGSGGWYQVGGTSAGAPQWAALTALVNQGRVGAGKTSLGSGTTYGLNGLLYGLAGGTSYTNARGDFVDVTSGSNGHPAARGYDLVTGLGSPVANKLVADLINA
jgi:subtilase family serine protease